MMVFRLSGPARASTSGESCSFVCADRSYGPVSFPAIEKSHDDASSLLRLSLRLLTITVGVSFSWSLKPMTWPSKPPGFGIGHSLANPISCTAVSLVKSEGRSVSLSTAAFLRLRFRGSPVPSSANCRRSTGQGRTCGAPTTRKEIARQDVKSDSVERERGWRWATIFRSFVCMQ